MKQIVLSFFALLLVLPLCAQSSPCFSMYISTEAATPGETVCLDVAAEGADNLLGFQYTMRWDPAALRFDRLENFNLPSLGASAFGTQPSAVDNGRLPVTWFDASLSGVDLSGGQVVYSVCFEVLGSPDSLRAVYFDRSPTSIEFVNANTELIENYSLVNGGAYTGAGTAPAITAACITPPDCQGGSGSIDISVAGGQPPYAFDWKKSTVTVSTSEDLTGDIGGRYRVEVANQQGVATSALFSVVPQGLPYIGNWQIDDVSCGSANDGSISVSIPGGPGTASLLWSNGSATNQAHGLAPGLHTLELSDGDGCSYVEFYTVGLDDGLTIEAGVEDAACNADNGSISPTITYNAGTTIDYSWSHGETSLTADSLAPGFYTLSVTSSNGCSATQTYEVQRSSQLDYIFDITHPACGGADGSIDLLMPNPGPYTFVWSTGEATEDIAGLAPGVYHLTVTTQDGSCSATRAFTLQETNIETYYDYECAGGAGAYTADISCTVASGGTPPFTFDWNTGQSDTGASTSAISGVDGAGAYAVTITDAAGCVQEVDTLQPDCSQSAQFLTAYSYECMFFGDGSSLADVTLVVWAGGVPPYTFEWSNGEVDVDSLYSVNESLANGAYTVTITDANGLTHYPGPAVVDCAPAPQDYDVGSSYECTYFPSEDSVSLDVSTVVWAGPPPPYTFTWSTGEVQTDSISSTITVSAPGIYSVTISDANGNTHVETVATADCSQPASRLAIEEAAALPGEIVCVEVSAAGFQGLDSLLLAIQWNPGFLTLDHVAPGLISSGFNLAAAADGIFQLDWSSGGQALDISGEQALFELCFQVQAPSGYSIPVNFHTTLQAPEAYAVNGQPIDATWQNGAVLADTDAPGDAVLLNVESAVADPGSAVCLDITTANFTDVLGVQFSLRWDSASLRFDSLVPGDLPNLAPATHFNLGDAGSGLIRFAWLQIPLVPVSLPDGAALFTLCFTAAGTPGTSTVAISSVPTLVEVSDNDGVLPVVINNGDVTILQAEVWPGDTDADGAVSHYDLLNIGLAYGASGPPRPNASISWEQQPAPGWQQATPLSQVDYKHIDTDGDGLIGAADTLAIVQNWGLQARGERGPQPAVEFARQINTVLYVRPDTVVLGEPAVFDVILGDETSPAENIYGLAFTIAYDTAAVEPGSAAMAFGNSWIGQQNQDLLALSRDRYDNGRIDVALTRTDGQNVSGQGAIAQLHITIQDVIFRGGGVYEMTLGIEDVRLINSAEEWAEVVAQSSTIAIGDVTSSSEIAEKQASLRVYPVPARGQAFIYSPQHPVRRLEVMGPDGRSLLRADNTAEFSVAGLPAGPYFLRVWTDAGVQVRRIVVVR